MTGQISVLNNDTTLIKDVVIRDESSYVRELMGEHHVRVRFDYNQNMSLPYGSRIIYNGSEFYLFKDYTPNNNKGTYEYNVKFESPEMEFQNIRSLYRKQGAPEAKWLLTSSLSDFASVLEDNLKSFYGAKWAVVTHGNSDIKFVEIDNLSVFEALNVICGEHGFNCDWWADGYTLHIGGKIPSNGELKIEVGKHTNEIHFTGEAQPKIGRLYAFGSTRNLPSTYKNSLAVSIIGERRLQMPVDYIDSGVKGQEYVMIFEDIYPAKICTASSVEVTKEKIKDTIDGKEVTTEINVYSVVDSSFILKEANIIPGATLRIKLETGDLAGMEFDARIVRDGVTMIIPNKNYGQRIPNDALKPKVGDKYVIFNYDVSVVSDTLIPDAEKRLKEHAESWLKEQNTDKRDAEFDTNPVYCQENNILIPLGQNVNSAGAIGRIVSFDRRLYCDYVATYKIGETRHLKLLEKLNSTIIREVRYPHTVRSGDGVFDRLISSLIHAGYIGADTADIDKLRSAFVVISEKLTTQDLEVLNSALIKTLSVTGKSTLSDVVASVLSVTGKSTLNEVIARTIEVAGKALFKQGLEVGSYTTGAFGSGASLKVNQDGKTELEVDDLTVRRSAVFRELVIEAMRHIGGELVLSPARMICNKVEDKSGVWRCYFDRGEQKAGRYEVEQEFTVGSQARCQVFRGSGQKYYWRLVTAIGDDWVELSKTDADGTGVPSVGDNIVEVGHRTDVRRQSFIILSAYGSDAPSFKQYANVNSYSLVDKEVTKLSPLGNLIKGDIRMQSGKSVETAIEDARRGTEAKVEEYKRLYEEANEALQKQLDKAIEYYQGDYKPTLTNAPAKDWATEEDKQKHLGDTFMARVSEADGTKAYYYRWIISSNGGYNWELVQDADLPKLYAELDKTKALADGKMTRLLGKYDEIIKLDYKKGDQWTLSEGQTLGGKAYTAGKVFYAIKDSTHQLSDWAELSYTDTQYADKKKEEAVSEAKTHTDTQFSVLDGKITSTVKEVKIYADKAVEGMQIGTDNLLVRGDYYVKNSDYCIRTCLLTEDGRKLKDGEIVTMVLKGKLGSGKRCFSPYNSGGNAWLADLVDMGNGYHVATCRWTGATSTENRFINIYVMNGNVSAESEVEWIKLVRGNKTSLEYTRSREEEIAAVGDVNILKSGNKLTDWTTESKTSVKQEGDTFIVSKTADAGDGAWGIYQDIAVEPDAEYILTIAINNDKSSNRSGFGVGGFLPSDPSNWNSLSGNSYIININSNPYKQHVFKTRPGDTKARIYLCGASVSGVQCAYKWVTLKKGNKASLSFAPSPDELTTRKEWKTSIEQTKELIASKVSEADFNKLGERVKTAESSITQTAKEIRSEVSKKVGNDEVISRINQTAETVKIQANKVEIDGEVVFGAVKGKVDNAVNNNSNVILANQRAVKAQETADNALPAASFTPDNIYNKVSGKVSDAISASRVIRIGENTKKFYNVGGFSRDEPLIKGFLIIQTPIFPYRMVDIKISGYNYRGGASNIDLQIGFYNYQAAIVNAGFVNKGSCDISQVSIALTSAVEPKAVIIIGLADTEWSYPKINIDEVIVGYQDPPDSYLQGWSFDIRPSYNYHMVTPISGRSLYYEAEKLFSDDRFNERLARNTTKINGRNITTGTVDADKLVFNEGFAKSLLALDAFIKNLKVDFVQVTGRLNADQISVGRLTGNPNFEVRGDGTIKFGQMVLNNAGELVGFDSANTARMFINSRRINSIESIANNSAFDQTFSGSSSYFSSSDTSGTEEVIKTFSLPVDAVNIHVTGTITVTRDSQYKGDAQLGLTLKSTLYDTEHYLGTCISLSSTNTLTIDKVLPNCGHGEYKLVATWTYQSYGSTGLTTTSGKVNSITLHCTKTSDLAQVVMGIDGIMALKDGQNYMHYSMDTGLTVKGKSNVPGILAAGTVLRDGYVVNEDAYGAYVGYGSAPQGRADSHGSGKYTVYHSIGHTDYTVQLTAEALTWGGNKEPIIISWYNKTANSFQVVQSAHGGNSTNERFSYVIFGKNKG